MRQHVGEDEPGLEMAVGQPLLSVALNRLIASGTLERTRAAICEEAAAVSHADGALLFEVDDRTESVQLTFTRGPADNAIDTYTLSRRLAVEAASSGVAHSSLEPFVDPELDLLADEWREGGRLCLAYPLRNQDHVVGALVVVCLGRGTLASGERWALRRFHEAAAAALIEARSRNQLSELALIDPLTGVHNRRGLELALAEASGGAYGLMMVDFDDLKKLNDQTDYKVGDQVLVAIGAALQAEAQSGETAARLGGDEFMLVIPETTLPALERRAVMLSQRLDRLEVPVEARGLFRGASVGFALAEPGEPPDELVERASAQMRAQKRRRKSDRPA